MQWFKMRPTFEIEVGGERSRLIEWFAKEYKRIANRNLFIVHGEYGELHLPKELHRLWSPHLSFYIQERNEQAVICGRFAPRIDVWTCVWIAYLLTTFTAFFASILAYSQWILNENMWGLWLVLLAVVIHFSIYVVAHVGQQWSVDQMQDLRKKLESMLADFRDSDESKQINRDKHVAISV